MPRWTVPAIALVVIIASLVSQVRDTLARADCLEQAKTEALICADAPAPWTIVLGIVVAILIGIMLVRQFRATRR